MLAPVAIPGHAEVLWNVWLDIQSCNGLYSTDTVRLPSLGLLFSMDWECGFGTGCPYVWGPAPNLELDPLVLLGKGILVLVLAHPADVPVLAVRNLHRFSLKNRHTSDERTPRVPVMPCGLAEKAITADCTAFRRCPNSGSSSIATQRALRCLVCCAEAQVTSGSLSCYACKADCVQ